MKLFGPIVAGTVLAFLASTRALATHENIKLAGFLDRASAKQSEKVALDVKVVNDGKEEVILTGLEPFPSDRAECAKVSGTVLRAHASFSVVCTFSPAKEGNYNLGVNASWRVRSASAPEMSAAYVLAQLKVISPQNSFLVTVQNIWGPGLVMLVLLSILLRRISIYQLFFGTVVVFGLVLVVAGLAKDSATFSIAGLITGVSGVTLLLLGKDGFRKFLGRLVKAGPVEFSPIATGSRALKISKIREQEFIRHETTPEQIIDSERRIYHYLALSRLEAYALEAKLAGFCTRVPPAEFEERESWLEIVKYQWRDRLEEASYQSLAAIYRDYGRLRAFKDVFGARIETCLNENQPARTQDKKNIYDAIKILQDRKDKILSPQYYVNLARMNLILDRRERALSLLYEGFDRFPDSLKATVFLADHLAILNRDFTSASVYGIRAIDIAAQRRRNITEWSLAINSAIKQGPPNPWVPYLKAVIGNERESWRECENWLKQIEIQLKNNIAYYIAAGNLYEYAARAEAYARSLAATETLNHNYLDTIGFVKLRFADLEPGVADDDRVKKDLKEACRLFSQSAKLARQIDDVDAAESAELHYEQAFRRLEVLT
jgi:hypothetical protein